MTIVIKKLERKVIFDNKDQLLSVNQITKELRLGSNSKNITEKNFCESLGWYRIYDCGKKRWIFER